jgi:hypothetical protein
MTKHKQPRRGSDSADFAFEPVIVRSRHDGWTAEKQVEFIQALAESGCVTEACARVGMSASSAYGLRARLDAESFRYAWDAALDHAVQRLSDAAFSRALNGVARPVFFQGEQIGERRYYDEHLTRFLLRYRDPVRYGKHNDRHNVEEEHADGVALTLSQLLLRVLEDGYAFDADKPRPKHELYRPRLTMIEQLDYVAAQFDARRAAERARAEGEGAKDDDPVS